MQNDVHSDISRYDYTYNRIQHTHINILKYMYLILRMVRGYLQVRLYASQCASTHGHSR